MSPATEIFEPKKNKRRIILTCHSQKEARFMEKWSIRGFIKYRSRRKTND